MSTDADTDTTTDANPESSDTTTDTHDHDDTTLSTTPNTDDTHSDDPALLDEINASDVEEIDGELDTIEVDETTDTHAITGDATTAPELANENTEIDGLTDIPGSKPGLATKTITGHITSSFNRLTNRLNGVTNQTSKTREITNGIRDHIHDKTRLGMYKDKYDYRLLSVRPSKDDGGIEAAIEMHSDLHSTLHSTFLRLKNTSSSMSFEIWAENNEITFKFLVPNEDIEMTIRKELAAQYPDSVVETEWKASEVTRHIDTYLAYADFDYKYEIPLTDDVLPTPAVNDRQYIAAQSFKLKQSYIYPIRTIEDAESDDGLTEDDADHEVETKHDFYSSIFEALNTQSPNTTSVFQVTFRAAKSTWGKRRWAYLVPRVKTSEEIAEQYINRDRSLDQPGERRRTFGEKEYADRVKNRPKAKGYHISLRVLTTGDNERDVGQVTTDVAAKVVDGYKMKEQQFHSTAETGWGFYNTLTNFTLRRVTTPGRLNRIKVSDGELAGLAHLPNRAADSPLVNWHEAPTGEPVPSNAPGFFEHDQRTNPFPLNKEPLQLEPDATRFDTDPPAANEVHSPDHDSDALDAPTATSNSDTDDTKSSLPAFVRTIPKWLREEGSNDEELVYCNNPSAWVSATRYALGAVITLIGIGVFAYLFSDEIQPENVDYVYASLITLTGIAVAWYERYRRQNRWQILSTRRVITKRKIIKRDVNEYPLYKIQDWGYHQSPMQKFIFGTGTVTISTAGQGDIEVELGHVKSPKVFIKKLKQLKREDRRSQTPHTAPDEDAAP